MGSSLRWGYDYKSDPLYVTIYGSLEFQGTYKASTQTFNRKPIYDREDGKFFAFMNPDRNWGITTSNFRDEFVNSGGGKGALLRSYNRNAYFSEARYRGQGSPPSGIGDNEPAGQKTISGNLYQQGTFIASSQTFNGKTLWDSDKFVAAMDLDGYWYIGVTNTDDREKMNGRTGPLNLNRSVKSLTQCDDFRNAVFGGQQLGLVGNMPDGTRGLYMPTPDTFNGKPIWFRPDKQLLAFQDGDGKWAMSGYQYLSTFKNKGSGSMGFVLKADNESESFTDAWFPGMEKRF